MKFILSSIILMIVFNYGFSQGIHYGIGFGLNYSTQLSDNSLIGEYKYNAGFQVNAVIDYSFNEKLGLRIEPGIVNKNMTSIRAYSDEAKLNFYYLNLPVLLRYSPFKQFSVFLGPEASFRLATTANINGKTGNIRHLYQTDYDLGLHAGISYRLTERFDLGLKYYKGFISTIDKINFTDENGNVLSTASLYNQGFSISLNYTIK